MYSIHITITKDRRVEVSKKIREEYHNGQEYYRYHGQELIVLPERIADHPDPAFIDYHNTQVFKG